MHTPPNPLRSLTGRRVCAFLTRNALAALLVLTPSLHAAAATITVDHAGDGASQPGTCSLRDAVRAANLDAAVHGCAAGSGADLIRFAASVSLIQLLDASGGTLRINGPLILDGEGRTVTLSRLASQPPFQLLVSDSVDGTLHPLELRWIFVNRGDAAGSSGTAGYGGGIYSRGPLALIDSAVGNCRAANDGGGVYAPNGLTLLRSTVSSNSAPQGQGGGIFALGNLSITQSGVNTNTAAAGGGIYAPQGATISDSLIASNRVVAASAAWGGGIYAGAALTVTRTDISNNTVIATGTPSGNAAGGGIYASAGLEIIGSAVHGNQVTGAITTGGGIAGGSVQLRGSTVSGNTVADSGGGIAASQLTLINSTVSGNVATRAEGAGIHASGAGTTAPTEIVALINSTVANNRSDAIQAFRHSGIWLDRQNNEGHMSAQSSLVYGNNGADIASLNTVEVSGANNLVGSVAASIVLPANTLNCNPQLLPLAFNGGETGNHALPPASCAIDAGSNMTALPFDQRGAGFPRASGAAADIGAYEWQDRIFADGFDND